MIANSQHCNCFHVIRRLIMYTKYTHTLKIIWLLDIGKGTYLNSLHRESCFYIWSSLQLLSTTAGMTTKQAIALEPNIPTSTITEPIFFDIMHSTRELAKISRMRSVDANVPRTVVRGGSPLINSLLKAPWAL